MSVPLAALREHLPDVAGDHVVTIAEGWDSDVFVVDGTWVVRIPRRPEVAARLAGEAVLLPALGPELPVPIPRVEAVAPDGAAWVVYRWIDGSPLGPNASARDVAAFLSALHRFPVGRAVGLGVQQEDWEAMVRGELAVFEERVTPLLAAGEAALARARFDAFLGDARSFAFRPALIHADLGPEHLLCASDGRLVGVIDWTDVTIGDPALDFAWLLNGVGERFAAELLEAYGGVDDDLARRAAFFHLLGPWHEVTYGLDRGLPAYVESGLAGVRDRLS